MLHYKIPPRRTGSPPCKAGTSYQRRASNHRPRAIPCNPLGALLVKTSFILTAILTSLCLGGLAMSTAKGAEDVGQRRETAHKNFNQGNFRDAYDALRGLLLDKTVVPSGEDLKVAVVALQRLNR